MADPRILIGLALALAAGCVEFERGPTSDTSQAPATSGETGETGDELPGPSADCDPLRQDCPGDQACVPDSGGFSCIDVLTPGGVGDVCLVAAECGPGLACVASGALAACDGQGCCSSLCEVSDGGAQCASASEECGPIFTGEDVPPEWAEYGVCRLPS
jgi:hypothetical protein